MLFIVVILVYFCRLEGLLFIVFDKFCYLYFGECVFCCSISKLWSIGVFEGCVGVW